MTLYERWILIRQIVHAVGLCKAGDTVGGANHGVAGPDRVPARLPCQAQARLDIADSIVGVVAGSDCRYASDQVEIDVLTVARGTSRDRLPAQSEIQRQIVFYAPVVLGEDAGEAVAQILVAAAAVSLLNVLRQTQHEIGHRTPMRGSIVARELAVEEKLPCQTGVPWIKIVHDVVVKLSAAVNHVLAVRPGNGVLYLPSRVMEGLNQIGVANGGN